jgi:hypothetical protein
MLPLARLLGWIGLTLGVAAAAVLLAMAVVRWRLVRRIRSELGREKVLLVTSSRLATLENGEGAAGARRAGVLALLQGGLYYHSWFGRRELFIPGPAITYIGIGETLDGKPPEHSSVVLRFLNAMGKEDGVIIRILSPQQWVSAIKTHLIAR